MTFFPELRINADRLWNDFQEISEIGATVGGGVSRLALSNEDIEARTWFADKIEECGLWLKDDEVGNLSGILFSSDINAKTLLVGSHLDTVPNGGRYDGTIGVLVGLECLRTIQRAGINLPAHLEVINFTDEEGTWQSLFGSMGLIGMLNAGHINDTNRDNAAFRAALFRAGILPAEYHKAERDPESLIGFLELHIEQGPFLYDDRVDIGVVTGIVGRATYTLTFYGEAAHAGTTSMSARRDALQGAAIFITQIHAHIRAHFPAGVVNCGNVKVRPGAFNVIPSEASLRVEVRHPDDKILMEMESLLVRQAQECARNYGLTVNAQRILHRPVAVMHDDMLCAIEASCQSLDCTSRRMVSYAGHDAQILSHITRSGMIFIPSVDGMSHNPREFTEWDNVVKGANVMLHTILGLILADDHKSE